MSITSGPSTNFKYYENINLVEYFWKFEFCVFIFLELCIAIYRLLNLYLLLLTTLVKSEVYGEIDHIFFMVQAMPSHASAAQLWSLSTLSCPASCVLPLVKSYSVLCSTPLSCQSAVS